MEILSTQMSRYLESPEINVCANEPYAPGLKDTERVFYPVTQFSASTIIVAVQGGLCLIIYSSMKCHFFLNVSSV